jgi:uncharacterized protein (DUF2236 family)
MSESTLFPDRAEAEALLVGPESITWRRASDARLYLVMLYPLLLQVAHPTVGAGVSDFSDFESRPWDRLLRTLDYVNLLVYGGERAIAAGRRLRSVHKGFRGTTPQGERYYALEPHAYAWVHATLIDAYVSGHAQFGTPLTPPERNAFLREYRGLGRLLGVRERDLPGDWASFRSYVDEVSENVLVRTESVDRVLVAIEHAPMPISMPAPLWRALRMPAAGATRIGGVGLMSPRLRERLGIDFSRSDQRAFDALGRISRAATPLMPRSLRVMGPAQLRIRRRAIATGPLGDAGPHAAAPARSEVAA